MSDTKCYMQRLIQGKWEIKKEITAAFKMIYLTAKGLSDKGEIKNIYVEKFAESEDLRVWLPDTPKRENTEIVLMFGFRGADRRKNYDSFCDWVSGHKIKYWDDARNREAEMILQKKIEPDKDYLIGNDPYLVVPFKFTNLKGQTKTRV